MRDSEKNKVKLYLIRHGMTSLNEEGRYIGKTDIGLSKNGITELERIKEEGLCPNVDAVYTGPMKRCIETARILYPESELIIINGMTETDFGSFEGKNYKELSGDKDYQKWITSNGTIAFPGGEHPSLYQDRIATAFELLKRDLREKDKANISAALICHGGNIMAIRKHLYGGNMYDYMVKNNEIVGIEIDLH